MEKNEKSVGKNRKVVPVAGSLENWRSDVSKADLVRSMRVVLLL